MKIEMKAKQVKFTDSTLGVKAVAYEVLKHLNRMRVVEKSYTVKTTATWYNGREQGLQLNFQTIASSDKGLVVVWSEARSSDSIIVYTWRQFCFNPAMVNDLTDEVYRAAKYFGPDDAAKAATYIHGLVQGYLDE